jgi:hypothetical protein
MSRPPPFFLFHFSHTLTIMTEDQLIAPPPQHCPGVHSEQAGKSKACEGCPNQKICATAPKGPDPGTINLIQKK